MTFIACILIFTVNGQKQPIALTGDLVKETSDSYIVDFSRTIRGFHGVMKVPKDDCINHK